MKDMINLDILWLVKELGNASYQQGQLEKLLQNDNLGKIERAIMELELKHYKDKVALLQKLREEISDDFVV